ncbi:hypothetical protein [Microvirga sp. 17 mud 1-3]|uniref:hypothetical protein n=1 Tax=Microvirga sp. 17 mud 1-3 TaxID=2082949 RepID=UPI000D6C0DDB|nr:hypothetical protein [Microvirga sp. 17 mud 1-3]AWM87359.1 hypothetical protein C4E04_11855 [Microvirga sp. 17 mud 1-3]
MDDRLLAGKLCRAYCRFDNLRLNASRPEAMSIVQQDMTRIIAGTIADKHIKEERGEFQTTFVLDVYVLTPDEFHQLVQQEAMELTRFMR